MNLDESMSPMMRCVMRYGLLSKSKWAMAMPMADALSHIGEIGACIDALQRGALNTSRQVCGFCSNTENQETKLYKLIQLKVKGQAPIKR